ncbi:VanZ family protein [Kineobactrum salinum]|uniref:VanZ-like domain-containing protein n=1 Tax=Kineobactrum salinum TaxID=2708301 RepID=A0A6C0TW72_9GAMM|nr:VanZ family protein [Kineobactrum salinum]QIB64060.1 hypothetical protein G3T16_00075 [Kineobactrum salinum]
MTTESGCSAVVASPDSALNIARYRLAAVLAFAATAVLLLLPGPVLSAAGSWLAPWWPLPSPQEPSFALPLDKLVHAGLFALCGLLVLRGWLTSNGHWLRFFLLLFLFAILTEAAQYPIPGRHADFADLLADLAGAAAGIWWGLRPLR